MRKFLFAASFGAIFLECFLFGKIACSKQTSIERIETIPQTWSVVPTKTTKETSLKTIEEVDLESKLDDFIKKESSEETSNENLEESTEESSAEILEETNKVISEEVVTDTASTDTEEEEDTLTLQADNGYTYLGNYYITGYDTCARCCGNSNGITASGAQAVPWWTIAINDISFGTEIYIEGLGTFCVQDRGPLNDNQVDVCVYNHEEAYALTGYYDVYIVN